MKMLIAIAAGALVAAAAGAAPPDAVDPDTQALACQLGADCAAPAASGAPDAATPGGFTPRSAATRGFTFRRTTASSATPAAQAASAYAAPTPVTAAPAQHAADLRLDFPSGSSTLDDGDRARLGKLAQVLAMPRLNGHRLRIEGHTDAKGSATANLDLSRRRAQAVADYLVTTGVAAKRLDVVGYGATKPLPGYEPTDGANRRVMAVMLD